MIVCVIILWNTSTTLHIHGCHICILVEQIIMWSHHVWCSVHTKHSKRLQCLTFSSKPSWSSSKNEYMTNSNNLTPSLYDRDHNAMQNISNSWNAQRAYLKQQQMSPSGSTGSIPIHVDIRTLLWHWCKITMR
jgi:hypothetical protein